MRTSSIAVLKHIQPIIAIVKSIRISPTIFVKMFALNVKL
jgi:hypothetical protein